MTKYYKDDKFRNSRSFKDKLKNLFTPRIHSPLQNDPVDMSFKDRIKDLFTYNYYWERPKKEQVLGQTTSTPIMPNPTVTTPKASYRHNIQIPSSQGEGMTRVPDSAAQALMESFDDIREATNAATVLHHPKEQTRTRNELKIMNPNYNRGENARFKSDTVNVNADGSLDTGLMQINNNTFNDLMQRHPDWMKAAGIHSYEQMKDPILNARVGRLILLDSNYDTENKKIKKNPNYIRWYAAPRRLRER